MRWLRRFCGGSTKPLKLLMRLFAVAVRAVVRAGSQKSNKINVRLFCGGCGVVPPYPHTLRAAFGVRRGRMAAGRDWPAATNNLPWMVVAR
jgi:hypothetical protein